MSEVIPEVEISTRILLSVNTKPIVMVKPDGNILIADGVTLSDGALAFWQIVADHGTRANAHRRKNVQDISDDIRVFANKVGGQLGVQLESWAEALFSAVEDN